MNKSRLEQLKGIAKKKPQDAFAWYGLAMEYKNKRRYREAIETFCRLLEENPTYTAAYFHYGQVLTEVGHEKEAKEIFNQGVQVAETNNDKHAQQELLQALSELQRQQQGNSPQ